MHGYICNRLLRLVVTSEHLQQITSFGVTYFVWYQENDQRIYTKKKAIEHVATFPKLIDAFLFVGGTRERAVYYRVTRHVQSCCPVLSAHCC